MICSLFEVLSTTDTVLGVSLWQLWTTKSGLVPRVWLHPCPVQPWMWTPRPDQSLWLSLLLHARYVTQYPGYFGAIVFRFFLNLFLFLLREHYRFYIWFQWLAADTVRLRRRLTVLTIFLVGTATRHHGQNLYVGNRSLQNANSLAIIYFYSQNKMCGFIYMWYIVRGICWKHQYDMMWEWHLR